MGSFSLSGGVEVLGFISPTDSLDTYAVIDPLYGIDGFRNVNSISDLNNIPEPRRRAGMVVGVSGGTQYYKLLQSPWTYTISDWGIFNTGGSNSGTTQSFTGGTVTGSTVFTNGLSATTISATTYLGLPTDIYVTGGTYSNGVATFTNVTGGTFDVNGFYTGETSYVNSLTSGTGLSANTTTGNITIINTDPDQVVVLNNGSNINVTGTYPNFTIDVTGLTDNNTYVTGFTYQDNTFTISDNSGSTFNTIINTVTGLTVNGVLSATTYQNLPLDVYVTGLTFNVSNYDLTINRNDGVSFTDSLSILASDLTVTGGTYDPNSGVATFTNNTGGTFNVSGFITGFTDIYTTGITYSNNEITISDTSNNTYSTFIDNFTGLTINGVLSATTIGTSGDCVDDIYVSNIHSCSPLNINPLDEGNVYFGSTSGVTFDLLNNKVGIGTSTPSTIFQVVGNYTGGTDALIPQMLFQNSNTIPNTNKTAIIRTTVGTGYVAGGYPEIWLESQETSTGVGLTKLRTVSNHPLLFYTNDLERVRLTETGNFGINTPSPSGKLHVRTGVNKNIIFTSGSTGNQIRSLVDGNASYTGLDLDTLDLNIKTNGVDRVIINSSGDTGIGTITPTAKLHINNTTSGNTFLAEDSTNPDSSPFVIDASGNTGIGIVTPTVKLHLSGNSIFEQSKLTINQKDGIVGIDIVNSGESMYQLSNSITDWCIVGKTPSEFYFYNSLNVPIRFYTNASEKMTVLGNGNVGIGITSPTAKLHINNTTSGNTFLAEDDTNPDSSPFVIDASGNTGIGTLTPTVKLQVSGKTVISSTLSGSSFERALSITNTSGEIFYVRGYGDALLANSLYLGVQNGNNSIGPGNLRIQSGVGVGVPFVQFNHNNGTTAFRILSNTNLELQPSAGNVLIGTTNDLGYKLNVNGSTNIGGDLVVSGITGTTWFSGNSSSDLVRITQTGSGNAFVVEDNTNPDSSPFVIDASGNTGIGTLTPQAKLDVSGTTRITGSITSNTITEYFNTLQGTQNISSGLTPFSVTTHTLFAPTISSQATNARPYALSIVPSFSGTINSKHAVYISNTNTSPTSPGFNTSLVIRSNGTSEYGQYIDVSGSSTVGSYIDQAQTGQIITRTPSGGIGLSINRNSTLEVSYTPINTFQQLSGTPSPSIFEYRNISSGNSTEINGLDLLNSSTGKFGDTLGNNAGINLRLGITKALGVSNRYAKIAAIAPNQTTLPDVIDLGLYVSNTGGTTTNAIYIKGSDQNVGIGTLSPTAKLQVKVNDFDPVNYGFAVSDSGNTSNYFAVNNVGQVGIRTPYTGSNNQFLIKNTNFGAAEVRFNVSGDYAFSMLDNQGYGFTSNPNSISINTRSTNGLINIWTQAANTTILALGGQDINPTVARTRTIIRPVQSNAFAFIPTGGTAIEYSFESQANSTFQPTGGTATYTQIQLRPTYNTTGSYSGTVRGLYYNPILTSLSGTTHRAIETTTGDVIFGSTSGNVGIGLTGTTSPTAKLHINNTTSGNTFLAEDDTNPDSTPFVIDASGNTGIGTLTPTAKLDIFASSALTNTLRIRDTGNTFNNLTINSQGLTELRTNGGGGATQFSVVHNGGTENFRVRENGNISFRSAHAFDNSTQMSIFVGAALTNGLNIGPLNIYDTGNTNRNLVGFTPSFSWGSGNNTGSTLNITPTYNIGGGSTTALVRGIYYNPTLTSLSGTTHRAIETTTGDVIFGSTSGNVGIGTTTPLAKLDVVGGDVALNGNRLFLGSYLGNQVLRNVETTNLQLFNSVGVLYLNAGDRVIFGSNNSTSGRWATFFNTGNLLIQSGGTHVDAGYRLDVSGNTRVSGDLTVIGSVIPNTQIISSSASVTPTYGNDLVAITGLSTNVTINNPTGTWPEGKDLTIRIKDNGVARTITWDTKYRAIGVTLPNTTIASKTTYIGLIYNSIDDKFDVIGSTTEL